MVTAAEFTRFALAFDGAVEGQHMQHPDFRIGKRIFASLPRDGRGMVRLTPMQQSRWLANEPEALEPASGAWGRAGCTILDLERVTGRVARELLLDAWQNATAHHDPRHGTHTIRANRPRRK